MKRLNIRKMMSVMLLATSSFASLCYADDADVAAIQALQATNTGGLQAVSGAVAGTQADLDQIKANTAPILLNMDMKNSEMVQAILNYLAAASVNQTLYDQELLFMAAPGSVWAVTAGATVGKTKVGTAALALSNQNFLAAISPYTASTSLTGPLAPPTTTPIGGSSSTSSTAPLLTKSAVYNTYFAPYVVGGDTSGLMVVNLAQFMQSNNLNTMNITPTQAQQMINLVLTPFPTIDPGLATKIAGGPTQIDGGAQDAIVNGIVENAIVSVSMSALSDIVARRTPGAGADPSSSGQATMSVMESMDQYSAQRFTNPGWYTQISTASDTALLRELAHMQAYSAWMQFQQFRVQEQQMALLATMNAVMAKMNVGLDQLNVQMQQAASQAQQAQAQYNAQSSVTCPSGQMNNGTGTCVCANSGSAPDSSGNCPAPSTPGS